MSLLPIPSLLSGKNAYDAYHMGLGKAEVYDFLHQEYDHEMVDEYFTYDKSSIKLDGPSIIFVPPDPSATPVIENKPYMLFVFIAMCQNHQIKLEFK